ncbi:hypothetical protein AUP68_16317 [Ilyonectria robusta]
MGCWASLGYNPPGLDSRPRAKGSHWPLLATTLSRTRGCKDPSLRQVERPFSNPGKRHLLTAATLQGILASVVPGPIIREVLHKAKNCPSDMPKEKKLASQY